MEFLECAGYRLMLPDCSRLSNALCPEMLRTLTEPEVRRSRHTTITSLADSPHGSSVMICSNCAFRSHVSASSAGICDFPDEPEFTSRSARNNCPCGKTWPELLSSWEGLSEAERKEKIYRICLFCTGHVRHKKMFTTVPTNCI